MLSAWRRYDMGRCMPKVPRLQSLWGQHGAHLDPVGPRWAPCWPHEPCYQVRYWEHGCIIVYYKDGDNADNSYHYFIIHPKTMAKTHASHFMMISILHVYDIVILLVLAPWILNMQCAAGYNEISSTIMNISSTKMYQKSLTAKKNSGRISNFHPQPQSALTGTVGHCVRPSVCPSVRPEWCYHSNSLRISAMSLKCGEVVHSTMEQIITKNGHARPFLHVPWNLKFSMIIFLTRSKGKHYPSKSLRISSISLKFGEMMHSNMKQIAISSGHTRPIFAIYVKLWNFPW